MALCRSALVYIPGKPRTGAGAGAKEAADIRMEMLLLLVEAFPASSSLSMRAELRYVLSLTI